MVDDCSSGSSRKAIQSSAEGLALARMSAGASFLRAVSPDSPRSQVGGLCEETLRRTGARFALSGALHPPGGHLQSSALSKVTRPRAIRHVSVVLRLVTSDRELTFEPNFLSVPTTKSISRMPACTKNTEASISTRLQAIETA